MKNRENLIKKAHWEAACLIEVCRLDASAPAAVNDLAYLADRTEIRVLIESCDPFDGVIAHKDPEKHPTIVVPEELATEKRNHALAHGIGHIVARSEHESPDDDGYSFICDSDILERRTANSRRDAREVFAHAFARYLLNVDVRNVDE